MSKLFGFSIDDGKDKSPSVVSPVPKTNQDGVDNYISSGFYGSYLDIEGVYKKLSGYYDNLKSKRILDKQFNAVFQAIEFYGVAFFMKNYNLKEDEVYEFVLGALENSDIEENFRSSNHSLVLNSFNEYYNSISLSLIHI